MSQYATKVLKKPAEEHGTVLICGLLLAHSSAIIAKDHNVTSYAHWLKQVYKQRPVAIAVYLM